MDQGIMATGFSRNMGQGSGAVGFVMGDLDGDGRAEVVQLWDNHGRLAEITYRCSPKSKLSYNRSFAALESGESCADPTDAACFLSHEAAAVQVVQSLAEMGAKHILLPQLPVRTAVEDRDQLIALGEVIQSFGLDFFTDESIAWENAKSIPETGHSPCDIYVRDRIQAVLVPLKAACPSAFAGFQLKDEPLLAEFDDLVSLKDCLRSRFEFQHMKVFLNLLASNTFEVKKLTGGYTEFVGIAGEEVPTGLFVIRFLSLLKRPGYPRVFASKLCQRA